jgi:hypothetical protein
MSSYVKSTPIERTVYLSKLDQPVLGVAADAASVEIKKSGQTSFQPFPTIAANWIELGNGLYTVIFDASVTDVVGSFLYRVSGSDFDNAPFDQFNLVDPSMSTETQSYFQDNPCERTVYLEKDGVAAGGISPGSVNCLIKKDGQTAFAAKELTDESWFDLGFGFYTIRFSGADLSRVGSFVYALSGTAFDNFAYDDFVVLAPVDVTVADKCVVSGQFVGLSGSRPGKPIQVTARPIRFPAESNGRVIAADSLFTFLDSTGAFEIALLRGLICIIEIPCAGIRHQVEIPDAASANILDLLPPLVNNYSF